MGDTDYETMAFNSADTNTIAAKSMMAEKIGYGDMVNVTTPLSGMKINPENEGVQTVMKAMNRDYSALVSKFKK